MNREPSAALVNQFLTRISLFSVTKCDQPDYESDEYNDSDYNYNSGANLSAKNETLLEEIIIIGNVSYSLDDLPTYNVTINLNLPDIKPLKEIRFMIFTLRFWWVFYLCGAIITVIMPAIEPAI